MKQYDVGGMSCAACSARVEKAVSALDGVKVCSVNLLTNSMTVEGDISDDTVISAVEKAGYTAKLKGRKKKREPQEKTDNKLLTRLTVSVVLTVILMYFSMGHMMWGFPVPSFLDNPLSAGIIQLVLSAAVMVANQNFFVNGFKGFIHKSPNMDTLVAMGSMASFVYSVCALFIMADLYVKGHHDTAMHYMHEFYFESAAMILTLITVGKTLEERSKGKTTSAISSLMKLAPKTAVKLENGIEKEIPAEDLKKGDIFVVKPGKSFAADGIVIEGISTVDESALTGESIPVDKTVGDRVSAATINISGHLVCEATGVGEDTALSRIIEMVSEAAATKAPIAKVANKVSAVFVPFVIIIAVIATVVWLLCGQSFGFALARGISVLVISCPCALGLATPVAIMVANGVGAKNGILFKTAEALEQTGKVKTVVLDKTGTITSGTPTVTDIYSQNEEELISIAYSLELKSEHPLGRAVTAYGESLNVKILQTDNFKIYAGGGICADIDGVAAFGGNLAFAEKYMSVDTDAKEVAKGYANQGKTPLFFGMADKMLGIIAVADTVKDTSKSAVSELSKMGIDVVMLTGDNKKTAEAIAKEVGISNVISDVLPGEKQDAINRFKEKGRVLMVGDGINDAPALTSADIGIAIGAGTDIAIDAADIVLVKNSLLDVPAAIKLSRLTLRNIKQNLFWAFCYNIIGIPLAAGVFISLFNLKLNPMFGAAAMSLSSFLVVSNALRLNFCKLYTNKKTEVTNMEKTIKIEGMMCPHCEARVKAKLEELDGVLEVVASHESKTAVIKLSKEVSDEIIKNTVEQQGYKVIG